MNTIFTEKRQEAAISEISEIRLYFIMNMIIVTLKKVGMYIITFCSTLISLCFTHFYTRKKNYVLIKTNYVQPILT